MLAMPAWASVHRCQRQNGASPATPRREGVVTMRRLTLMLLLAVTTALVLPVSVSAQRGRWHGDRHHFHAHDHVRWRRGHWVHGHYGGRFGWWWTVDGSWYWYPRPVYPYPEPYIVYPYPEPYIPPPVIMQVPVAPAPAPAAPPQAQAPVWYYCAQPEGYYPYVPTCPSGWQTVPATPQPIPAPVPSAPVDPGR